MRRLLILIHPAPMKILVLGLDNGLPAKPKSIRTNYGMDGLFCLLKKRVAHILATDLKHFAESNGNFSNLSANEVYSHLQSNQ